MSASEQGAAEGADSGADTGVLPEHVLDLLVVGGGPAGTAAAFRAKELGLDVLVVDFDDLMKRIRDYSKDKLILPSFGGGDQLAFPAGGDLIAALQFAPIDKDDLCARWKNLYREHEVPFATGIELLGMQGEAEGLVNERGFEVRVFDHGQRQESTLRARCVALALGRGVPRRFDIPGNTEGVAFRLNVADDYVGAPACVVGGGTSAAEAVIAISNAKARAEDHSAVYWSYRGDRMPRVSQALAEVFFAAYVGNGNIRYYPRSEPSAIVVGDDHREYLSLRVDRRCLEDRPNETSHLEFPKEHCIACIGEDLPEQLLAEIGVERVEGGKKGRKRVLTSPILESRRANVFLLGDLLSQAYLQTEDFAADPATFEEVRHRGNIKTALRDGVLVAEAVQQRLDGVAAPRPVVRDALSPEGLAEQPALSIATEETLDGVREERAAAASSGEPAATTAAAPRTSAPPALVLLQVQPGGDFEELMALREPGSVRLGRTGADLSFENDALLAEHHATVERAANGEALLRDESSPSGTYLRLQPGHRLPLEGEDLLQVGRQFLQLDAAQERIAHYDARGQIVGNYELGSSWMVMGREAPDITLDAGDRSLSRRHLAFAVVEGQVMVKDLRSANGTYLRLRRSMPLRHGTRFRIGQQQLAVALGDAVLDLDVQLPSTPDREPEPSPLAQVQPDALPDGPRVTFQPSGETFAIAAGQSICELAEQHGIRLNAECHAGICGSDPVRILAGHEHLAPLSPQESETLEDVCELEPGPCRLACMARVTGPVTVEIVQD